MHAQHNGVKATYFMKIRSKVWLEKDGKLIFGSGKAQILQAVAKTGSLNAAAKELDMSYRHVWSAIRAIEERLGQQLLVKNKGGSNGGGATLTKYARDLLAKLASLDLEVKQFTNRRFEELFNCKKKG